MSAVLSRFTGNPRSTTSELIEEANEIYRSDIAINLSIAKHGLALVPEDACIIHHCNTGSLATADYGTALGIIRYAHEMGKNLHVFLDETRPRLQGSTLSAFELSAFKIPHTVVVDSAAGHLMKSKRIDLCLVGCDRVAANGDTANKIGTYTLALVAKAHGVPFYVACPSSTIDLNTECGDNIEIEVRNPSEITKIGDRELSPVGTAAYNPAFDVTPAELVTGFVTERGIVLPPFS
jgi:methylthioribose-1-phosphate isomerase